MRAIAGMARSYRSSTHCSGFRFEDFQRNVRTRRSAPSGGRVKSEFQGLSGMDAARASLGHGWPVDAGP